MRAALSSLEAGQGLCDTVRMERARVGDARERSCLPLWSLHSLGSAHRSDLNGMMGPGVFGAGLLGYNCPLKLVSLPEARCSTEQEVAQTGATLPALRLLTTSAQAPCLSPAGKAYAPEFYYDTYNPLWQNRARVYAYSLEWTQMNPDAVDRILTYHLGIRQVRQAGRRFSGGALCSGVIWLSCCCRLKIGAGWLCSWLLPGQGGCLCCCQIPGS